MSASPEAPIPLAGVAGFNRNQWQLSAGISGNLRLESVAGFDRNQWQPSRGIRNSEHFKRFGEKPRNSEERLRRFAERTNSLQIEHNDCLCVTTEYCSEFIQFLMTFFNRL